VPKFSRHCLIEVCVLVALLSLMWTCGLHNEAIAQERVRCAVMVNPGESIQAAIDRAEEGMVICLAEGVWEENIKIERSLTLRGTGRERTVIKGVQEGLPVVWITDSGDAQTVSVGIEELMITGGVGECADRERLICPSGLLIQGKAWVEVVDCFISLTALHGVRVNLGQVKIIDSTISRNKRDGLVVVSGQATLTGATISGNGLFGIRLWGSAQLMITGSMVHGNSGMASS